MTEEDTFNKLKQIPLRDIVKRLHSLPSGDLPCSEWVKLRTHLLEENNYKLSEYYHGLSLLGRNGDYHY